MSTMGPDQRRTMRPPSAPVAAAAALTAALALALACGQARAILVQPHNHMLDDAPLTGRHEASGSLSPFYNDQTGASEASADRDIVSIIGDGLARLRFARMLEQSQAHEQGGQQDDAQHLSSEMAELLREQQVASGAEQQQQQQTAASSAVASVASMLLGAAQAAAAAASQAGSEERPIEQQSGAPEAALAGRGPVPELDTSSAQSALAQPSKSDLKQAGPSQWYNPKETIPVLKISSMATPSKYKKVYFRSEKKLVDGAFHSPASEQEDKSRHSATALAKPFNSGVQRRSSRGSSAAAPPSVLQDGVIDFLKKFRDVYVQTRPAGSPAPGANLANVVSAAASSPLAAILAPGAAAGSRPSFMSALSSASQMVNSAALLTQAASGSGSGSASASAPSSGAQSAGAQSAAATVAAAAAGGGQPGKSPLSAQSYVSFWSKTFPTWVRKMLKQMRRRSLYNSSKRQHQAQQHHSAHHNHHHHHSAGVGQKIASGAVSGLSGESAGSASSSS